MIAPDKAPFLTFRDKIDNLKKTNFKGFRVLEKTRWNTIPERKVLPR